MNIGDIVKIKGKGRLLVNSYRIDKITKKGIYILVDIDNHNNTCYCHENDIVEI